LHPNCENLAVFRSGLAANILLGLIDIFEQFLKFAKFWPNLHVVPHSGSTLKMSPFALSQACFLSWQLKLPSLTSQTQRMGQQYLSGKVSTSQGWVFNPWPLNELL